MLAHQYLADPGEVGGDLHVFRQGLVTVELDAPDVPALAEASPDHR